MSMASDFLTSIVDKLKDFSELEIRTIVGEMSVGKTGNNKGEFLFKEGNKVDGIISKINLVDGDIETRMSPEVVGNPQYETILSFHMSKEKEGQEIMLKNLEVLKSIANTIMSIEKIGSGDTEPDAADNA